MCYTLYGAVNEDVNQTDYEKYALNKEYCRFRITHEYCDCGTSIGAGHINKNGLKDAADYLMSLQKIRGIKHAWLCKVWTGDKVEQKQTFEQLYTFT